MTDRAGNTRAALGGLLAGVGGLGAGHLVAGLAMPQASPVVAVAGRVIDLAPPWLKDWGVKGFGTNDKAVLVVSVAVVAALLCAGVGVLTSRRRLAGFSALATLGVVCAAAAVTAPNVSQVWQGVVGVIPALVTASVGAGLLAWLVPARAGTRSGDRRQFLQAAATAGALGVIGTGGGTALSRTRTPDVPPVLPTPATPLPAQRPGLETSHSEVSPLYTPIDDFYRIDISLTPPVVRRTGWNLTIDGSVTSPLTLTWDELVAMPMVEHDITLNCVSNEVGGPYIGTTRWLGVRMADLLDKVGLKGQPDMVLSTGADGFTASTPLPVLLDGRQALVAIAMGGRPLTQAHGYPVRLVTPGLYGYVGATKWLTRLTVTRFDRARAYWTDRGWAPQAPVKTGARIDSPALGASLLPGRTAIGGVAWAQHVGIKRVEVRVDDGEWQTASLGPDIGVDSWRQWYVVWQATSGEHRIACRAVTLDGQMQTETTAPPIPNGASGWHTVTVSVQG